MNERFDYDHDSTDHTRTYPHKEDQAKYDERRENWRYYENPDLVEEDDREEFQEEDQGDEHEVDHATEHDDSAESSFATQYGWRGKVRRQKGTWVSPDITEYHTPQFVPVVSLHAPATSDDGEETAPEPPPAI